MSSIEAVRADGYDGWIVGFTAATLGDESQSMIDAGADADIQKPLNLAVLVNAISSVHTACGVVISR